MTRGVQKYIKKSFNLRKSSLKTNKENNPKEISKMKKKCSFDGEFGEGFYGGDLVDLLKIAAINVVLYYLKY